jgi:O-antigen ligase
MASIDPSLPTPKRQSQSEFWGWWQQSTSDIAVLMVSGVGGALLVALSWQFRASGPLVFVGLATVPLIALIVFELPVVGLLLVFAAFPIAAYVTSVGSLPLQPLELVVVAVAVLIGIRRLAHGQAPLAWSPVLWWALALLGWTLVALPSAADQSLAVKHIMALVGGLMFACVVMAACRTSTDLRRTVGSLLLVAALIATITMLSGVKPESAFGGAVVTGRAVGTFDQPNQLGAFSAMVAMLAAGMVFAARTLFTRVASLVTLGIVLIALTLSLSRGAWIGSGLGAIALFITLPRARKTIATAGVLLAVALLITASVAPQSQQLQVVGDRLRAFGAENPYDSRPAIWAEARREIQADPWTGQGPGSFPVVSSRSGSEATTVFADHAHNLWLQWGAEVGLPSVFLICAFVVGCAVAGRRARWDATHRGNPGDSAIVAGAGAALVTVLGQGLVDYPLKNQVIWFTVWTMVGILLAARVVLKQGHT